MYLRLRQILSLVALGFATANAVTLASIPWVVGSYWGSVALYWLICNMKGSK